MKSLLLILLGIYLIHAEIFYDVVFDPRGDGFTQDVALHLPSYQVCCIGSIVWLKNGTMVMIPCGWDPFYFSSDVYGGGSTNYNKLDITYSLGCGSAGPIGDTIFSASQTGFNAHYADNFTLHAIQPVSGAEYTGRLGLGWRPGSTNVYRVFQETEIPSLIGYYDYQLNEWVKDWFVLDSSYNFVDGISWNVDGKYLYLSARASVLVEVDADTATIHREFHMGRIPDGCAFLSTSVGNIVYTSMTDGTIMLVNLTHPNPTAELFAQSTVSTYGDLSGIGVDGCWYVTHMNSNGPKNTVSKICPPAGLEFEQTSDCLFLNYEAFKSIRYEFVGHTSRLKLYQPYCPGDERNNYIYILVNSIDEVDAAGTTTVKSVPIGNVKFPTIERTTTATYTTERKELSINPGTAVTAEYALRYYTDSDSVNDYLVQYGCVKFDLNLKTAWPFASDSNEIQYVIEIRSPGYTYTTFPLSKGTEVIFTLPKFSPNNKGKVFFPNTATVDGAVKTINVEVSGGASSVIIKLRIPHYTSTLLYDPIACIPLLLQYDDPFFQANYPAHTTTYTTTSTSTSKTGGTATGTGSGTGSGTGTDTVVSTDTTDTTATNSGTATGTNTGTATGTNSGTATGTNSGTNSGTKTGTATGTNSGTNTGTNSGTNSGTNGTGTDNKSTTEQGSGNILFAVFSVLLLVVLF